MTGEQKYDVVYAGAIKEGFSCFDVKNIFVQRFKLSTNKVELYFSGKRMVLKKGISKSKADKLIINLQGIGAEALVVPSIVMIEVKPPKSKNTQSPPTIDPNTDPQNTHYSKTLNSVNDDVQLTSDNELNKKIKLAQSLLIEQQLKSQISGSNVSPQYTKLVLFLIILGGVIGFLYYLGKNSI